VIGLYIHGDTEHGEKFPSFCQTERCSWPTMKHMPVAGGKTGTQTMSWRICCSFSNEFGVQMINCTLRPETLKIKGQCKMAYMLIGLTFAIDSVHYVSTTSYRVTDPLVASYLTSWSRSRRAPGPIDVVRASHDPRKFSHVLYLLILSLFRFIA
jgi:hypothetical protein